MLGLIDESVVDSSVGGIWYALALVVCRGDAVGGLQARILADFSRTKPFHWNADRGSEVRRKMLARLQSEPVAVFVYALHGQTRDAQHLRERILERQQMPGLEHCDKSAQELWLADAAAGAVSDLAMGRSYMWLAELSRTAQLRSIRLDYVQ